MISFSLRSQANNTPSSTAFASASNPPNGSTNFLLSAPIFAPFVSDNHPNSTAFDIVKRSSISVNLVPRIWWPPRYHIRCSNAYSGLVCCLVFPKVLCGFLHNHLVTLTLSLMSHLISVIPQSPRGSRK
ncbi:hypothetical protein ACB094_11G110700 [Castanea mollissima]